MTKKILQKSSLFAPIISFVKEEDLPDFWRVSSKWWVIPVVYVVLAFFLAVIMMDYDGQPDLLYFFIVSIIALPHGIAGFFPESVRDRVSGGIASFVVIFLLVSMIGIQTQRNANRILRWLIILALLIMILSFIGCAMQVPSTPLRFGA